MKYLYLAAAGAAAWFAWNRLAPGAGDALRIGARGEFCSYIRLSAEVQPTRADGRKWDQTSPPDIVFQVGKEWTAVCHDSHTCRQTLELPVPADRIELKLWDKEEKDQISGDEVETELISNGRLPIDGEEAPLGLATVSATCLD